MNVNEIQMIMVDPTKTNCKLGLGRFWVRKEFDNERYRRLEDTMFYFTSTIPRFVRNSADVINKGFPWMNQFRNQLGYIMCRRGYIDSVHVFGPENGLVMNARNCGMGTALTSLCLIDPDLDAPPTQAILEYFKGHKRTLKAITRGCRKFVGLQMKADPLSGAYAYFNAALDNGYNKMVILTDKGTFEDKRFRWYDTEKAKECYDDKTGKIGIDNSFSKNWWFCVERPGKLPKFPGLNPCGDKPKPK